MKNKSSTFSLPFFNNLLFTLGRTSRPNCTFFKSSCSITSVAYPLCGAKQAIVMCGSNSRGATNHGAAGSVCNGVFVLGDLGWGSIFLPNQMIVDTSCVFPVCRVRLSVRLDNCLGSNHSWYSV